MERIASTYILRRYTRNACVETEFDRHDTMLFGPDGDTKARRARSILSDLFKLQWSAIMSETAMQTARSIISNAVNELDKIPHDVGLPMPSATVAAATADTATDAAPSSSSPHQASATAPPISTTKGSHKKSTQVTEDTHIPHFDRDRRKKRRKCSKCGLYDTGHNAATCDKIQQQRGNGVTKRPRGRPRGSGRGKGVDTQRQNATTDQGIA